MQNFLKLMKGYKERRDFHLMKALQLENQLFDSILNNRLKK